MRIRQRLALLMNSFPSDWEICITLRIVLGSWQLPERPGPGIIHNPSYSIYKLTNPRGITRNLMKLYTIILFQQQTQKLPWDNKELKLGRPKALHWAGTHSTNCYKTLWVQLTKSKLVTKDRLRHVCRIKVLDKRASFQLKHANLVFL